MRARALRLRRGIMLDMRTPQTYHLSPSEAIGPFCVELFISSWTACTVCAGYRYLQLLCVMTSSLSTTFIAFNPAFDSGVQGNPRRRFQNGMHSIFLIVWDDLIGQRWSRH